MRKFIISLFLTAATFAAAGAEKALSLSSEFQSLSVCSGASIVYVADGSRGAVIISGPDDKINNVEITLKGGTLFIGPKKSKNGGRYGDTIKGVTIKVKGKTLTKIEATSGASVKSATAMSVADGNGVLTATSGGEIKLKTYHVKSLKATASSGGEIEIDSLAAAEVNAVATSGGEVELAGSAGTLTAKASSGGSVDASGLKVRNGKAIKIIKSSGGSVKTGKL